MGLVLQFFAVSCCCTVPIFDSSILPLLGNRFVVVFFCFSVRFGLLLCFALCMLLSVLLLLLLRKIWSDHRAQNNKAKCLAIQPNIIIFKMDRIDDSFLYTNFNKNIGRVDTYTEKKRRNKN